MNESEFKSQVLEDLGYIKGQIKGISTEQEDNKKEHREMWGHIDEQGKEVAALKVKAGIWGVVGGVISGALVALGLR